MNYIILYIREFNINDKTIKGMITKHKNNMYIEIKTKGHIYSKAYNGTLDENEMTSEIENFINEIIG